MEYTNIDPAAELKRMRLERAITAEVQAVLAELDAEQFDAIAATSDRPGAQQTADHLAETAAKFRASADAAHALAVTTPEIALEQIRIHLRDRVVAMEMAHLRSTEQANNAEAYSNDPGFEQQQRWAIIDAEAGLTVLRAGLSSLAAPEPTIAAE